MAHHLALLTFASVILQLFVAPSFVFGQGSLSNVKVSPTDSTVGAGTIYTIDFITSTNGIPKDGKIRLTFPIGFDISTVSLAVNANGSGLTGGYAPADTGQVLTLTRDNTGNDLIMPDTVVIKMATVINSTASGSYTLFVETLTNAGALIDTARSSPFQIVPGALQQFALSNVSTVTAGTPFNLTITAKDVFGNTATAFNGKVGMSINSGTMAPDSSGVFSNGVRIEPVTIQTAGSGKMISVRDASGKIGSSNSFTVNPGPLHHFLISNILTPQTAGVGFAVTITAQDQYNNTATDFVGTVTISDTTNTVSPTTSGSFVAGVRTETVSIKRAVTNNRLKVSGSGKTAYSNFFNVIVGPVHHFAFSPINTATAGVPFSFSITAKDASDNTVTSYSGTINLSDNTGTLTPPTATISSGGTVTVTNAKITKAQSSVLITAVSAGNLTGTSNSFNVLHGPLDHFAVTNIFGGNIDPQFAGTPFNLRLAAQDTFNNTVTSFTTSVTLSNTTTSITPATSGNFSSGILASLQVKIAKTAISDQITVTGGSPSAKIGVSNKFPVSAGSLADFKIDPVSSPQTAGTPFNLKITAIDTNGNTATAFSGTVSIGLIGGAIVPSVTGNFVNGVWNGTVTVKTSGTNKRITATNGTFSDTSNVFDVNPGPAVSFAVTDESDGNIATQTAGTNFTVKVTAKDANGNVATGFTGTVTLSDNTNTLTPKTATISSNGTVTVTTAKITRAQAAVSITAVSGSLNGTSNSFAVTHALLDHFSVTDTSGKNIGSQIAGKAFLLKLVAQDQFNNTVTSFTSAVTLSNTTTSITPTSSGNFTNGVLAALSVKINKTSTADVIAVSGGSPPKPGSSNSFVVNPGVLAEFRIDPISSPQIAGTPFPLTITALDSNQNTVTSFTGTVNISLSGGGNITPQTTGNFVFGVWNGNVTALTSGAGKTITVTDGVRAKTSNPFDINPGALDHFTIGVIGTQTAGENFTVTVTAKDAHGNNVNHTGTVTLTDNTGTLTASSLVFVGQATQSINDTRIRKAQSGVKITASGSGKSGLSNDFTVNPAPLDHFTVTSTAGDNIGPQTAGTAFNIKIVARDAFENTVTNFNQTVTITDLTTLNLTSANFVAGVLASQSVTIDQARNDNQLTVRGGLPERSGASNLFNVIAGVLDHFTLDTITDQAAGVPFDIVIYARDAKGNVATSFTGTVALSDLTATIAPTSSGPFIRGIWSGSVKITTTRQGDIISVSGGGKNGSSNPFNVVASTVDHFTISNITNKVAGATFPITITAKDANDNTVTSFNGTVALSDLSASITPTTSNPFNNGTLTQNFTITKSYTGNKITVTGVGKSNQSNAFDVTPAPLHHFAIAPISNQTAGLSFPIKVTAQDTFDNTVTGFNGTVTIGINSGTITPTSSNPFDNGVLIQSVTIPDAGSNRKISVNDGSGHTGTSNAFNVDPSGLHHFVFSTIATQAAGVLFTFTITAKDASGNDVSFNGTVNFSDTTGTLTPTSVTMSGTTASVTNARITRAQTGVVITATGGGKIGRSNFFTVQPGPLSRVRIVEGSSGDGAELTTKSLTADEALPLHAAAYDAFGNYRDDQPVNWLVTTTGLGVFIPATSTRATTFYANKTGTGKIIADHTTAIDDTTGTITVSPGIAHHIKVLEEATGNRPEAGNKSLLTGDLLTVHAGSFDADDNYRGDISVTWTVSGGIGTLSTPPGVPSTNTTLTATTVGSGVITGRHTTLGEDATGLITVDPSPLGYIKIVEGPSGKGDELGNRTLTTDQTLIVHAAGYDAKGNYLADYEVTWSLSDSVGRLSSTFGPSTELNPTVPGTAVIFADHESAVDDQTGTITVLSGNPHHIKILQGLSGKTPEVKDDTLATGETLAMHASSFDADDNWLQDESVSWSVSGGIGSLNPMSGPSTTFTATTAGTGVISAVHPMLIDDATGTITVTRGSLHHIKIVEGSFGHGPELNTRVLTTDQTLPVHAAGYDINNNYLGDEPVTWSVTGGIGTFTFTTGASTTLILTHPGSGRIIADHATALDDTTGDITVSRGELHHVKVLRDSDGNKPEVTNETLTADDFLIVHAGGFDADDNYIDDVSVAWSVSNGIGTLNPITGKSTTFTAKKVGTGQITAAHPTALDDLTGTIKITPGNLAFIKIFTNPKGSGIELGDTTITTDQSLTLFAAGFDADSNYIDDQPVIWSSIGSLTPVVADTGKKTTTFAPARSPATGTIRASHASAGFDETGTIRVNDGVLHHIKVLSGVEGETDEVGATTLNPGQTLDVHAGGYDAHDNYISDESVNWTVTGSIGTLSFSSGLSTTFTATTVGSGVIRADHPTSGILDANSGTITVSIAKVTKIILRTASNNGGAPFNDRELTADDEVSIYAAGYDGTNYFGDVSVTWSNTGNLDPAVSATGSSFTFSPRLASASGSVNGKIIGAYSPSIKDTTGTIRVYPGTPRGRIELFANPASMPADTTKTSTITSVVVKDAELNEVGPNKLFTVTLTPDNLGRIITPDVDPGMPDHQVATNDSSKLRFVFRAGPNGGVVTVNVNSVNSSATGSTRISLGSLRVLSVVTAPTTVSRGQSGILVTLRVENLSSAEVSNLRGELSFMGSVDRTGDYGVTADVDNPRTLAGNSVTNLLYFITVNANAALESITIDGAVFGEVGSTPVSARGAGQTDSWTVQRAATLTVQSVAAAADAVTQGQSGLEVVVNVANNLGLANSAAVTVDSVRLVFTQGATPRTMEYVIKPVSQFPALILGGQEKAFRFIVDVGISATPGTITLDAQAYGKEGNSNAPLADLNADTTDSWVVIPSNVFRITSITPSQPNVTTGMEKDWQVVMAIANNGPSGIALNLANDKTYIRLTIGSQNVTSEYNITPPTALDEGGTGLARGSNGHLTFRITRIVGNTTGVATISGAVAGQDSATGLAVSDNTINTGNNGQVIVQSPAELRIDRLDLSQTSVTANQVKDWTITATVTNTGGSAIKLYPAMDSLKIAIGNNQGYVYRKPNKFADGDSILEGPATKTLIVTVDTTGGELGNNLPISVTLAGLEINSDRSVTSTRGTATITVQSKAELKILSVRASQPTVSAGSSQVNPWQVTVVAQNNGGSAVRLDTALTNLRFRSGAQFQNDYVIQKPKNWLGTSSLTLAGARTDSLRFVVTTTGARVDTVYLAAEVITKESNSGVTVAASDDRSYVLVQTPPLLNYIATSLKPAVVNNNVYYAFSVRVHNDGGATVLLNPDSTRFFFGPLGGPTYVAALDRNNVTRLDPGDTTLTFRSVQVPADMPQTTYTPQVELRGAQNSNPFSDMLSTDVLLVSEPAKIQIVRVQPSQASVTAGMTKPWNLIAEVRNNGGFSVRLDSVKLAFFNEIDVTRLFDDIVYPTVFLGTNKDTLADGATDSLRFVIRRTPDKTGNTTVNVRLWVTDLSSGQQILPPPDNNAGFRVQSPMALKITSLVASQPAVTINQTRPWHVDMNVTNRGESEAEIAFDGALTKLTLGLDAGNYRITPPTELLAGGNRLAGGASGTLRFIVTQTGSTSGNNRIDGQITALELNSGVSRTAFTTDTSSTTVVVQTPAQLRITTTRLTNAPNAPYVNTKQPFEVQVSIENFGQEPADNVQIRLTPGNSQVRDPILPLSGGIGGGLTEAVTFNVTADSVENLTGEVLRADVFSANGHNTGASVLPALVIDDTARAVIQKPAGLKILQVATSEDTLTAGVDQRWFIFVVVKDTGGAALTLNDPSPDNIAIEINGTVQTGYRIQPDPFLLYSRSLTLVANQVDTLMYTVTGTGLSSGQATIFATLKGSDNNNRAFVTAQNVGHLFVKTSSALQILQTYLDTTTVYQRIGEVGLVNTNQVFRIELVVNNSGFEDVRDVEVRFRTRGKSRLLDTVRTIAEIKKNENAKISFGVQADTAATPGLTTEVFWARVISGRGFPSGDFAKIAAAADSTAQIRIQRPAQLAIAATIENNRRILATNQRFRFSATVTNAGQAEVDASGLLTLSMPAGFSIINPGFADSVRSFIIGERVEWELRAPDRGDPAALLRVTISQAPKDLNSRELATVSQGSDTITVNIVESGLVIEQAYISWPEGAKDDTLSTGQEFIVTVENFFTDDLTETGVGITVPAELGYRVLEPRPVRLEKKVEWRILAPENPHDLPAFITVRGSARNGRGEYVADSTRVRVVTVARARLRFSASIYEPEGARDGTLSFNQALTIRAFLQKANTTGLSDDSATVELNLGGSGLVPANPLQRLLRVGDYVEWRLNAPPTQASDSVTVTVTRWPFDENTGLRAALDPEYVRFAVRTDSASYVKITDLAIVAPAGASDRIVSTRQPFTLQAQLTSLRVINADIKLELPSGFTLDNPENIIRHFVELDGKRILQWRIQAPGQSSLGRFDSIRVKLLNAQDKNNNWSWEQLSAPPQAIGVSVVEQARLTLDAKITAPRASLDGIVSRNQAFTITARLLNSGEARPKGRSHIELYRLPRDASLDSAQDYRTAQPRRQELADLTNGMVTWTIWARSKSSTALEEIRLRLVDPFPADENTDTLATIVGIDAAIGIQTEPKSLMVQTLPHPVRGPVARGETGSLLLRLKLTNSGSANSSNVLLRGFSFYLRNRDNAPVTANEVIKSLRIVDTHQPARVLSHFTSVPAAEVLSVPFAEIDTLAGGVSDSLDILVDVVDNTSVKTFRLIFAHSAEIDPVDAIDEDSEEQVEVAFLDEEGRAVDASAVASQTRAVVSAEFESSFFNYPNPFNPKSAITEEQTTTFNYSLPQASEVEFRIYTLLGELVYTRSYKATDPQGASGPHRDIVWDGRNGKGDLVLNGVYIAVLKTSTGTVRTKVAVVK